MARTLSLVVVEKDPDPVLIDAVNPSRDALDGLTGKRPVAMCVEENEGALTRAAIQAGASAYAVAGLRGDWIKPVSDAAIARFHMMQKMRVELAETRRALKERKVIDRAKGIFLRAKGLGEDAAYALMRKAAMDQGKKVADVAQALVTAAELLK
jgi:response regulator NasT